MRGWGRSLVGLLSCAVLLAVAGPVQGAGAATRATSCPTREVHRIGGWLHTCRNEIVDSHHHLVRPISVAWYTMSHDAGRDPSLCQGPVPPSDHWFADLGTWGFNAVYLGISWANVENKRPTTVNGRVTHHYDQAYLQMLDGVVNNFASHGVRVILVMGQNRWSSAFTKLTLPNGMKVPCGFGMPTWLYRSSSSLRNMVRAEKAFFKGDARSNRLQGWFARAWKTVAKRYARNSSVIGAAILHEAYDILAQPYPGTRTLRPSRLKLARFYERVGKAIHAGNRRLLIFVPDHLNWDTGRFALTRKPRIAKEVYSFEFHAPNWRTSGRPRMAKYWKRAIGWHLPGWVEEFYAFLPTDESVQPSANWAKNSLAFLHYAKRRHIGWSYGPAGRLPNNPKGLLETLQAGY